MVNIAVCWRRPLVVIAGALIVLLGACSSRPVEDPNRARCKRQVESFYSLTQASNFFEKGYTDSAFDAVIALAAELKDSKDSYCKLVGEKAIEIEQNRATRAKAAAEVEADVARLRAPTRRLPEGLVGASELAPDQVPAPARDAARSDALIPDAAVPAPSIPDAARPDYAPPPRHTYCQWTVLNNGIPEKKWGCFSRPPEGAKPSCEERRRGEGIENPDCSCTTDLAISGGKCQ